MELVIRVWQSSQSRKYLMALSGCALFLFVVGHMVGNLQVFLGPEAINRYGHFLQSTPEIAQEVAAHGRQYSVQIDLTPLATTYFKIDKSRLKGKRRIK